MRTNPKGARGFAQIAPPSNTVGERREMRASQRASRTEQVSVEMGSKIVVQGGRPRGLSDQEHQIKSTALRLKSGERNSLTVMGELNMGRQFSVGGLVIQVT